MRLCVRIVGRLRLDVVFSGPAKAHSHCAAAVYFRRVGVMALYSAVSLVLSISMLVTMNDPSICQSFCQTSIILLYDC